MHQEPSRNKLISPGNEKKILLHSCCAPCSGELIEAMKASGLEVTLYYYNPNIYPKEEYELRKNESKRFCEKMKIPFIEGEYENDLWKERVKGYENEPERGKRCSQCFDLRFEKTAQYAKEHRFKVFTSGLGISRWKDMDQITRCGIQAAKKYDGLTYWDYNWRKSGGSQRMYEIAKREHFYKQEYCGCVYSLEEANNWRTRHGKEKIKIGKQTYKS